MFRILAVLVFVCFAGGALAESAAPKAAGDPAARAYTEKVAAGLAAKLPGKFTVVGDFRIRRTEPGGGELLMSTANHYSDYKANPANIDKIVDAAVAAIRESKLEGPHKLDAERIVPVIKDRAWLEEYRRAVNVDRTSTVDVLHEDYNDQLVVVYAEDTDNRTRYLAAAENACNCSNLRARAVANLARLLPKVETKTIGPISVLTAGGDYEASLLLFDDIWRSGEIKVNGEIVAAVPTKDMLMVTGSKDRKGVKALRELAVKFFAESRYSISQNLFVYRDGRFVKYGRN